MRRKACSSDPLWPLQLQCCCICFVHGKMRGWSDPPLLHKKRPQDSPKDSPGFLFLCSFLETAKIKSVLFVCLFVETICTTLFSWLEPLHNIFRGLLGKATGAEQCHNAQSNWDACREAVGHRQSQQSYRRKPGRGSKACCDCCSGEQGDRYAEDRRRQKKAADTVVRERLQLSRGMDMIRLEGDEGEAQQTRNDGDHIRVTTGIQCSSWKKALSPWV